MADHMHNKDPDRYLGEHRVDSAGKALLAIKRSDEDIVGALVLDLVYHPEPELGPLGLRGLQAQNLLVASNREAQGQVDRFVADCSLVSNFDSERVEYNDRVNLVQGLDLPFGNFVNDLLGDSRDQIRRHRNAVMLLQMSPDLAHRHATSIHVIAGLCALRATHFIT